MANQLTIGVSEEVKERLEILSRSRGQSLNATVLEILEATVGDDGRRRSLLRYATWGSEDDLAGFEKALAAQRPSEDDPRRIQEAKERAERLYRAYELMAAEEEQAGADVESYFPGQAETFLEE